jgi:hypothetical protein
MKKIIHYNKYPVNPVCSEHSREVYSACPQGIKKIKLQNEPNFRVFSLISKVAPKTNPIDPLQSGRPGLRAGIQFVKTTSYITHFILWCVSWLKIICAICVICGFDFTKRTQFPHYQSKINVFLKNEPNSNPKSVQSVKSVVSNYATERCEIHNYRQSLVAR